MTLLMAVTVAILYAAGMFLILRRSIVKLIFGLALLGHGANVLIFASSPLVKGQAPLVPAGDARLPGDPGVDYTDPLPPALILTAIVISFAIVSFTAVLVKRAFQEIGTDDSNHMIGTYQ